MQWLKHYRNVFFSHITIQLRCSFQQIILLLEPFKKNWGSAHLQHITSKVALLHALPGSRKRGIACGEGTPTSQKPQLIFRWWELDTWPHLPAKESWKALAGPLPSHSSIILPFLWTASFLSPLFLTCFIALDLSWQPSL